MKFDSPPDERCPICQLSYADDNDTTHECPPGFLVDRRAAAPRVRVTDGLRPGDPCPTPSCIERLIARNTDVICPSCDPLESRLSLLRAIGATRKLTDPTRLATEGRALPYMGRRRLDQGDDLAG